MDNFLVNACKPKPGVKHGGGSTVEKGDVVSESYTTDRRTSGRMCLKMDWFMWVNITMI